MNFLNYIHGRYVQGRRVQILSQYLAELIPQNARVLDVGCGDGLVAHLIMQSRPDIQIRGVDLLVRPHTYIPVAEFDGEVIPAISKEVDVAMFVDVLHHTNDPMILLREGIRVAKQAVVIKDHRRNGTLAYSTLRFMDWIGNAHHGVALSYNYWPQQKWFEAFDGLGLIVGAWKKSMRLYPPPASWIFDRSLHFIARLDLP